MRERSYHIITFGCQMNVHDSRWLGSVLQRRGFAESPLEDARVVVVNTCSVREKPEQKVMSALGRIRQATGGNPDVLVAVTGCVAQQLGEELFRQPQVRLVAGSDGMASAPQAIERLLEEPDLKLSLLDFTSRYEEREEGARGPSGPVAYVNIMQGCDNFCAYCIVPYTRGRQKSRRTAAVLEDCRRALEDGAREICLLGQNVNAFGRDKYGDGVSFADLLRQAAALPGLLRLRYVTPHPKDMGPEDVALFGELPALCPRLHLPLQAGSDAVLARMGRKYDAARFVELTDALRAARPDIALSTDLIVGFPGETEEDFQQTLALVRRCGFMSSFSFCYSDRPGTRASRFLDKIAPDVQQDRLLRLQALQEELGQDWLDARVGGETDVLIEGESRRDAGADGLKSWQGRDPYGALVHVGLPHAAGDMTGRMVRTRLVEAKKHSLLGQQAGEPW
ncbi:tRNA (N6-isopentenyl adenosine(37)-C2)-methylthiotransferase MiaB [uncultured Desulfovibrio sp.]|uniref:tRNA (N6-isopentenyl adenosine(37)-C2)-methylthiotransferase MiaB n=1 Tax=uncultured Desulfovibrio sp. TaxID=167968 RepID=UPI00262D8A18|nr:tRNA (N6-isopentenyl adenosine(37)-C2)-methylthiotransferase MiaB [uncultured Desulfovibrio sp.]